MPRPAHRPAHRIALVAALVLVMGALTPGALAAERAGSHAAATADLKQRVVKTTPTVAPSGDQYFVSSSFTSARCKGSESIVGLGLASADRYLAASAMGWLGVEAYAVGDAGPADVRWQLLCAKHMLLKVKQKTGKAVIGGTNTATATVACPAKHAAVPAPFTQTFAPFMGSYDLAPTGKGWKATISGFPTEVVAVQPKPVQLHVLCVPAKKVSYQSQSAILDGAGQVSGTLTCPSGRALGFGFRVDPYTSYPTATNSTVPMVRKAQLSGSALVYSVGTRTASAAAAGDPVTMHVVCGVPTAEQPKKK